MTKKDKRKKTVAKIVLTMLKGDAEMIEEIMRQIEEAKEKGGEELEYKKTRGCLRLWLISEMLTSANLAAAVRVLEEDDLKDGVLMKLEELSKYMHTEAKNLEKHLATDEEE
jgi:hypothetical protein